MRNFLLLAIILVGLSASLISSNTIVVFAAPPSIDIQKIDQRINEIDQELNRLEMKEESTGLTPEERNKMNELQEEYDRLVKQKDAVRDAKKIKCEEKLQSESRRLQAEIEAAEKRMLKLRKDLRTNPGNKDSCGELRESQKSLQKLKAELRYANAKLAACESGGFLSGERTIKYQSRITYLSKKCPSGGAKGKGLFALDAFLFILQAPADERQRRISSLQCTELKNMALGIVFALRELPNDKAKCEEALKDLSAVFTLPACEIERCQDLINNYEKIKTDLETALKEVQDKLSERTPLYMRCEKEYFDVMTAEMPKNKPTSKSSKFQTPASVGFNRYLRINRSGSFRP